MLYFRQRALRLTCAPGNLFLACRPKRIPRGKAGSANQGRHGHPAKGKRNRCTLRQGTMLRIMRHRRTLEIEPIEVCGQEKV